MKILFIYPEYPDTFWGFRHALKFVGKKAPFPPLGLLTVAAMLDASWEKRLIDMNVQQLADRDIRWADYVFISAMTVQRQSVDDILSRCRSLGVKTVAGGPLFTTAPADFGLADHLVLGEAEMTLRPFLEDLEKGCARHLYTAEGFANVADTPVPLWALVDSRKYGAMNIQYSRGCPFDCEFCDITQLFGRKPRTKSSAQLVAELDALNRRGWRGGVFFVDDNFIGDKRKLKHETLPAIIDWAERHKHPFDFYTEASIDLADDSELMGLMVKSGFEEVFIGIETPHDEGHVESGKVQNKNRDLLDSVKRIQQAGLQVQAGFIVGFDSDPPSIFERQIAFIQESGIVTAMVGMLTALRGTKLHQRLLREGRLLGDTTGNNTTVALNFIPSMKPEALINGYRTILTTIYAPRQYYQRVTTFLKDYRPHPQGPFRLKSGYIGALFKSMLYLGVIGKERFYFWKLFIWSLLRRPRLFGMAITFAIYGYHFRKITENISWVGLFSDTSCLEQK
ncbi:MAG: DUF4070 domain-containing protein [Desulfobacteraceae bacterium]|nr:DUF4070 domain-containing protein [Desulfobacteraceae bacterium]